MRARTLTILLAGCSIFAVAVALAGSSTIVVKDGNSTSKTYDVITDGSGNFVGMTGVCDGTAAAQCAAVKPSGTASAQTDAAFVVRNPDVGSSNDGAFAGGTAASSAVSILKGLYTGVTSSIPTGTNLIGNVGGTIGAAVPSIGPYFAGQARSSEPSAATNANLVGVNVGLEGKLIVLPYANKENMLRGTGSTSGTAATTIIAAQGASVKIYVTDVQCYRNDGGTTADILTLNDSSSTVIVLPNTGGGGGSNIHLATPLVTTANGSLTFTSTGSVATIWCNAQGYAGS